MADDAKRCPAKTEVYSRVCGFYRPVQGWNEGKQAEFAERRPFDVKGALAKFADQEPAEPEQEAKRCSSNG